MTNTPHTPPFTMESAWRAFDDFRSNIEKRVGTRMGKGDVRAAILSLLTEEPMHGYQIIRQIEERTDGLWKPSAGSVYPTLQLLADEGLVTAETANDRKVYALTDAGREVAATIQAPWATASDADANSSSHSGFQAVSKAGFNLAQAVSNVARSGTAAQQEAAVEVLDTARRKIYSILAQD
jgi:DNA-binding PadR family transcriptional regulator